MNMFDNKGELNASDLRDCLAQINKFAAIMQAGQSSNSQLAGQPGLSETQRDDLITKAIMSQDGKVALAQAMANPIN